MRVHADRDRCVSGGMCALTAPNLFDQDEEGLVLTLVKRDLTDAELEAARESVALCPTGALSLREDSETPIARELAAETPHLP